LRGSHWRKRRKRIEKKKRKREKGDDSGNGTVSDTNKAPNFSKGQTKVLDSSNWNDLGQSRNGAKQTAALSTAWAGHHQGFTGLKNQEPQVETETMRKV